jgi:hypothetical protein
MSLRAEGDSVLEMSYFAGCAESSKSHKDIFPFGKNSSLWVRYRPHPPSTDPANMAVIGCRRFEKYQIKQ